VAERVLVCVRPNLESQRLIRGARRLAARLRAEWLVVWVESPGQPALSQEERRQLAAAFALAEQLGAETATVTGVSVPSAVLRFARERNVSKLVVGKPTHARWRDRLRGSLVDEIVRTSGDLDVFVISGEAEAPASEPRPARRSRARLRVRGRGGGGGHRALLALHGRLDNLNLVMIYLLGSCWWPPATAAAPRPSPPSPAWPCSTSSSCLRT